MIRDPEPYSAMRDYGFIRLGEVPDRWRLTKLRTVLRNSTLRNRPDLPLLSVVREKGVIVRDISSQDENHNFIPDDLTNYKVVRAGQFAMNKMKAWQGSYGVSEHEGIVSPAYYIFDLRGVAGGFFNTAIRSKAYVPYFSRASDGVRVGQWDLSLSRMREIPFAVPPPEEQAAIVRYLDHVDRRVRRLVRAKRKLIALLNEQKQAIIHRAVTRGLDPDVRLKDSGVEWPEQIPQHWEMRRNGRLFSQRNETGFSELPILEVSLRTGVSIRELENPTRKQVMSDRDKYKRAATGDIAYNMMRMWQGAVGIAPADGLVSPAYIVARPLPGSEVAYYEKLFRTAAYMQEVDNYSRGIVKDRNRLYWEDFKAMPSCYPPQAEQLEIALATDEMLKEIDLVIDRAKREIELLNEYRTRLIADVVTGKLDVCEAVTALPEVDPLDATDTFEDSLDPDMEIETDDTDLVEKIDE